MKIVDIKTSKYRPKPEAEQLKSGCQIVLFSKFDKLQHYVGIFLETHNVKYNKWF